MSHDNNTVLSVRNVSKDFFLPHNTSNSIKESVTQLFKPKRKGGDVYHALKGISFDVKKGDFFGVVGRNGAGKSTLLRIMAEIYQPTKGSVQVKGRLVPFIELGVGFNNNLTGRQNVYLNGAMLGFSKKEMDERYDAIVKFAELEKFMDQKLKNYSSGMRVRLAFSVAIQADADILLLDEVLAVGDANFKKKCFAYFDKLKENKKTIILVSHSMGTIREYCNRAILIEDGKITHEGSADTVADAYNQLFADDNEVTAENTEGNDHPSNKNIHVGTFELTKTDEKIKIDTTLVCGEKPVNGVTVKIEIKNRLGRAISAFDNLSVKKPITLNFTGNETKKLTFDMDNIYKGGTYLVGVTVVGGDEVEVYDERQKIATFSSYDDTAPYQVASPGELSVKSIQ